MVQQVIPYVLVDNSCAGPKKSTPGSTAYDLFSRESCIIPPDKKVKLIPLNIKVHLHTRWLQTRGVVVATLRHLGHYLFEQGGKFSLQAITAPRNPGTPRPTPWTPFFISWPSGSQRASCRPVWVVPQPVARLRSAQARNPINIARLMKDRDIGIESWDAPRDGEPIRPRGLLALGREGGPPRFPGSFLCLA